MKTKINLLTIWVLISIIYPPIIFGETVDEEVLVLFEAGTITMPDGKITASLKEINAPPEVLPVLQNIDVLEISKGLPDFEPKDTLKISPEGWIAKLPDFSNLFVLRLPVKADRDSAIFILENLSDVIYAEKNQRAYPEYEPNDPERIYQWYLGEGYIGAFRAFDFSRGSGSTKVGIIDTGVDRDHDDLQNKVLGDVGYNIDHGTHVAGIAAAKTDNDVGIVGLDWYAQIWAENYGNATFPELTSAVISAVNAGCKIINNSWGTNGYSETLYSAFTYAYQMGALPVSSMSNTSAPHDYPKRFGPWMMNVGSTGYDNEWYQGSVTGYWIDVGAPGVNIYSTLPGNEYGFLTGTSMASPVVSGIAGLLLGANPNLKNYDLEWLIKLTATDRDPPGFDDKTGYGRVNADTAVKRVILPHEISRGDVSLSLLYSGEWWQFDGSPLPYLDDGFYYCDVYKVECNLSFSPPYATAPIGWTSLTGFSAANPNNAHYWMNQQITSSSATLTTFFYYIRMKLGGPIINRWAPVDPNLIPLKYTIIGRKPIDNPTNLQASGVPNSNDIKLMWNDNSHNELKFKIFRSTNGTTFPLYDSVGRNVTQYMDNNTIQGQEYWYRVQAWAQEFHSGYSNVAYVIAGFAAPSNLIAETQTPWNSVQLSWEDNSSNEDGFEIWRSGINEPSHRLAILSANTTSYPDVSNIKPFYDYSYQIRAFIDINGQRYYSDFTYPPTYVTTSPVFERPVFDEWGEYSQNARVIYGADKYHLVIAWPHRMTYCYSTDGGFTWSDYETIATLNSGTEEAPSIAVASDGSVVVVWVSDEKHILYRRRTKLGWGQIETIYTCELDKELTLHTNMIINNNVVYAAWTEKGSTGGRFWEKIYYTYFPYTNPLSASIENAATQNYYHPEYNAEPQVILYRNTPHIVWQKPKYLSAPFSLYHSYKIDENWTQPIVIAEDIAFPSIAVFRDTIYCVSRLGDPQHHGHIVIYSYSLPSGEWIQKANLGVDKGNKHHLITSSQNNLCVVAQTPQYEIRYFRYKQGHFVDGGTVLLGDAILGLYPDLYSIALGQSFFLREDLVIAYGDQQSIWGGRFVFKKRSIPWLPSQNIRAVAQSNVPEATGYNNSQRLICGADGVLNLAFTNDNNVYHTFLQDTSWTGLTQIGAGKYPSLCMGTDNNIYSIFAYNEGSPNFLEELRTSKFDGNNWSSPVPLMHSYDSYLWGVGAPSFAIADSVGYFIFETSYGRTYHPAPGDTMPMAISFHGYALVYGEFPLVSPDNCQWYVLDSVPLHGIPEPIDTAIYEDSVVAKLISPSITVDTEGVVHVLWEGFGDSLYYYRIEDTAVAKQTSHGVSIDYPLITRREDQIDHFWCEQSEIRHRYGWTGIEELSDVETIAECENPFSSGPYLTWTQKDGLLSHLYYGEIPASGMIEPIELDYSTDLIAYPQILYNPARNNEPTSIDLVWTEYSYIDSSGYIYHLNLPIEEVPPMYVFDMGEDIAVPIIVQRDGYQALGPEDFQTIDYDSTELIYHLSLHSPHIKYKIRWTYYHEEQNELKLQFTVDDILHRNRKVSPSEKVIEEAWIPQVCLQDNELTIKVKRLKGSIAVLSGMEIEMEEVGGGGGPQGYGNQALRRFLFEQMYPNPAKGALKIRFTSPDERKVSVKMYDVVGRLTNTVFEGKAKIGVNEFLIVPKDLPAGVYFVRVEASVYEKTQKIILLR